MSLDREIVVEALPAYEVGQELGRGAYGIVLAGVHRQLHRHVAIKQLPRAFGADPDVRKRFLAEARTLASMDHPHIVPIFDFVERDGVCLLVMEQMGGGTLWSRMRAGELDVQFACATALAAAAGLEYAHLRSVLHRDIKPENLMYSNDGVLKVTDFGIAKVLGGSYSNATRAGYALGTPAYMAPEQAQGKVLSPATDVYALGTVLFEMLSGELPFSDASDPVASLYQHVHEDPRSIRQLGPRLPAAIGDVVDTAIARSLDVRYPTAAAFKSALADATSAAFGADWTAGTALPLREITAMPPKPDTRPKAAAETVVRSPAVATTNKEVAPPPTPLAPSSAAPGSSRRGRYAVAGVVAALALAATAFVVTRDSGDKSPNTNSATNGTTTPTTQKPAGFSVDPPSAAVGETITVSSTTKCPALRRGDSGPIIAYVELIDPRRVTATDNGGVAGGQFPVEADRSWTATFAVPGETSPGEARITVSCLAKSPEYEDPVPYFDYPRPLPFTVTPAGAPAG